MRTQAELQTMYDNHVVDYTIGKGQVVVSYPHVIKHPEDLSELLTTIQVPKLQELLQATMEHGYQWWFYDVFWVGPQKVSLQHKTNQDLVPLIKMHDALVADPDPRLNDALVEACERLLQAIYFKKPKQPKLPFNHKKTGKKLMVVRGDDGQDHYTDGVQDLGVVKEELF